MKLKAGLTLRKVGTEYLVMKDNTKSIDFNDVLSLNETGAFIFNLLKEEISKEELLDKILNEYDVSAEIASADLDEIIKILKENNLLIWK